VKIEASVIVVTGAGSGLGLATAMRLAGAGAFVAAIDRDEAALESLWTRLDPSRIHAAALDVRNEGRVAQTVDEIVRERGRIDALVNCAGVADAARTLSRSGAVFPDETWDKVLDINLTGTFNMVKHCARAMANNSPAEGGERGAIVNTASGAAWQGQAGQAAYGASKAGVMGLTLPVARDLSGLGIRINCIAPGLFDTNMVAGMPAHVTSEIAQKMVLFPRRMGRADEFAHAVEFLLANAYMNAATLALDGGARVSNR
jgi:NAD(P)-dependent dehydrogenase (short-subunit alcohol dehydrogenase family)